MRTTYYRDGRIAVSITIAKRLLRSIGGEAETHHIERDGTVFYKKAGDSMIIACLLILLVLYIEK